MNRAWLLAAIALAETTPLSSQTAPAGGPERSVDSIMRAWVGRDGPGAALLVMRDGGVVLERGYGLADVDRRRPIGPETRFLLGSVSKQFTAMAVMILAERGLLRYDDPLRKFFPQFPSYADSITVRHLLNHLGGLPEYEELFVQMGRVDRDWPRSIRTPPSRYEPTARDALQLLAEHATPRFRPGERYEYSNSGYMILAQIVERVTGTRFHDFLRREVFDPLGMQRSVLYDETTPPIPDRASSYTRRDGKIREIDYTPFNHIYGEDNVVTTIGDLARWIGGLDSARLVSRPTLELAYTPGRTNDGRPTRYGFGWAIGRSLGARVLSHGGSWIGFRTAIRRYPDLGLAVAVLANWAEADPEAIAARVAQVYLGDRLERRTAVSLPRRTVDSYLGRYVVRAPLVMTVRRSGAGIRVESPLGASRMLFDSDSTAFVEDNPAIGVTFRRDGTGTVTGLVFHHLESDFPAVREPR